MSLAGARAGYATCGSTAPTTGSTATCTTPRGRWWSWPGTSRTRRSAQAPRAQPGRARAARWRSPSDWAFIMKTGTMVDYAVRRTKEHLLRFLRLHDQVRAGTHRRGLALPRRGARTTSSPSSTTGSTARRECSGTAGRPGRFTCLSPHAVVPLAGASIRFSLRRSMNLTLPPSVAARGRRAGVDVADARPRAGPRRSPQRPWSASAAGGSPVRPATSSPRRARRRRCRRSRRWWSR